MWRPSACEAAGARDRDRGGSRAAAEGGGDEEGDGGERRGEREEEVPRGAAAAVGPMGRRDPRPAPAEAGLARDVRHGRGGGHGV